MTEREKFEAWKASSIDQDAWAAWHASRQQTAEEMNVLATFAHEVLMGAYAPTVCMWKARAALERAGLGRLEDVVALAKPTEGKKA